MAYATTKKSKEKIVKARAGIKPLTKIAYMAFGNGGCLNNEPLAVDGDSVGLYTELLRKPIDTFSFPNITTCRYSVRLLKTELINIGINEIALIDEEGDLVAIRTFKPKYKDGDIEMIFEMEDIF